jgi:hypothetical protein
MITKSLRYFLFLILLPAFVMAQDKDESETFVTNVSGVGVSAATFLEIGVGARAAAMGGAYAAIANDATALYWNPAGIAWLEGIQVEFMHSEWLAETTYDYLGLVVSIPSINSSIGTSILYLNYGESPVRTVTRPEGTGEKYSARDLALSVSYALALTDRFSFGLSGKYISQRIWSEEGSAFAVDVGVFYKTGLKGLQLGASMSNFGSDIQLQGRHLTTTVDPDPLVANFDRVPVNYKVLAYALPLLFRVGLAYEQEFGQYTRALVALDVNHPSNTTESINLGMEVGIGDMFYFRGGYENMFEQDAINGLTLGGGIDYYQRGSWGIRIDYAWSDWDILDKTQRFSVGIRF